VVESTGLENRRRGNPFEGSNPSPSATFIRKYLKKKEKYKTGVAQLRSQVAAHP
jgi:hypothetical protein